MRRDICGTARTSALTVALLVTSGLTVVSTSIEPALAAPRAAAAASTTAGTYQSMLPARILDTGNGTGAPKKAVASHATLSFQVTGRALIPASGVASVVLNVTAASTTGSGYLTVYPTGVTRPTTSNLNFTAGHTTPNLVVARLGTGGKVSIYNGSSGSVRLIADIAGYYLSGTPGTPGALASLNPTRILDTGSGLGAPKKAVASHATLTFQATGVGAVPASGASAVSLNVTVAGPTGSGYVTVYPAGVAKSVTSSVNFATGQTRANAVVVQLGTGGKVSIYNGSSGSVRLIADVAGYYLSGTATQPDTFTPLTPARILDTGSGVGAPQAAVASGEEVSFTVSGRGGVPVGGASAAVLNITVAAETSSGYITAFSTGGRPTTSNLNFLAGHSVANLVVARVRGAGRVTLYNGSSGTVRLIADVSGYYRNRPSSLSWSGATSLTSVGYSTAISCATSTFCAAVTGDGKAVTGNASSWSVPTAVGSLPALTDVSCSSATFCVAVGGDHAATFNGSSWATPVTVGSTGALTAVSCASTTFCVAVDSIDEGSFVTSGHVFVFSGASWSSPVLTATGFNAVSCPSATFCAAVDDSGDFVRYDGSSWSVDDNDTSLTSDGAGRLSCTSASFCAATRDGDGTLVTFDGTNWSAPTTLDSPNGVADDVSCRSATSCVAVTDDIDADTFNGTTWSTSTTVMDSGTGIGPHVSCGSAGSCILLSGDGYSSHLTAGSWSAAAPVAPATGSPRAVSCASSTFCLAVTDSGLGLLFNGATWSDPVLLLTRKDLQNVSCPTSTFCLAMNVEGDALVFNGATVTSTSHNDLSFPLDLSCADPTFCVASDGQDTSTFNGASWSAPVAVGANVGSISCPAANVCLAGTDEGVVRFNGVSWSAPAATGLGTNNVELSCSSTTSCVGGGVSWEAQVGDFASALSESTAYNGTSWSAPTILDPAGFPGQLSCVSSSFCVEGDEDGNVATYDGTHWSDPVNLEDEEFGSFVLPSCPTATLCVAVSPFSASAYIGTP